MQLTPEPGTPHTACHLQLGIFFPAHAWSKGIAVNGDRFQLLLWPLTALICPVPSTGEHRSPSQQVLFFLCCGNTGAHSCFCLAYRLQSLECYFSRAVLGSLGRVGPQLCPGSPVVSWVFLWLWLLSPLSVSLAPRGDWAR